MGGQPGGFGGARASARSRDQQVKVLISLEDAYQGASRSLQLQIPEVSGNGQVVSRTRTLQVRIPKGIREGQRIRLSGQSGSGGDLYLEVEFQPDPLFRIDGMNILLDLPLAPIREEELDACYKSATVSHQLHPCTLLALTQELHGHQPHGVLLSVLGHDFEFGEGLSPGTSALVPQAAERIMALIEQAAGIG